MRYVYYESQIESVRVNASHMSVMGTVLQMVDESKGESSHSHRHNRDITPLLTSEVPLRVVATTLITMAGQLPYRRCV